MSDQPVLKFMLTTKGAINLAFGAGLLIAPALLLSLYGMRLDATATLLARLFGAACLGLGAVQFFARNAPRGSLQSLLVGVCAVADLIGFAVALIAQLTGVMDLMGWGVVAIYAFAGFGFGLTWIKECRGDGAAAPATAR